MSGKKKAPQKSPQRNRSSSSNSVNRSSSSNSVNRSSSSNSVNRSNRSTSKAESAKAAAKSDRKARLAREAAAVADPPRVRDRPPRGMLISLGIVIVVVVAASLFLWFRNERPGPSLERWAEATRSGDCDASYGGLSSSAKQAPLIGDQSNWCQIIGSPDFIGSVTAESVDVKGNLACIHASISSNRAPTESRVFVMAKEGSSWKVDVGADPNATGIPGCTNEVAGGPTGSAPVPVTRSDAPSPTG